jgi:D-alanyl-D-alanine carboxypeptidase
VLRYQQNQAATTGYQFEPWHFRYVGPELAGAFKTSGKKSLEAYFNLPKAPNY